MTYKDGKRGKEMLLVPIGGRPQPVVVNSINKTLRCEMFACAFDETWDDDVEVLLYVNDAGKFDGSAPNRAIRWASGKLIDIVFGNFLIVAIDRKTASTIDMPAEVQRFYQQKYSGYDVNWEQRPQ